MASGCTVWIVAAECCLGAAAACAGARARCGTPWGASPPMDIAMVLSESLRERRLEEVDEGGVYTSNAVVRAEGLVGFGVLCLKLLLAFEEGGLLHMMRNRME